MPQILLHSDPLRISTFQAFHFNEKVNVLEWMHKNIELDDLGCTVTINGNECADVDKLSIDEFIAALNFDICDQDVVSVFMRPRGIDPISLIIIAAVSIAVTLALIPKPQLPNDIGKQSSSPNNQLNASTNQYRPRQAIPDISGQVVSYPDFIQPSYYEYVDNLKIFKEIFCIGVGRYTVTNVKTGDTLLNDINGASYTVHPPGSIPSKLLLIRGTNDIDGLEIIPPDDPSITGQVVNGTLNIPVDTIKVGDGDTVDKVGVSAGDFILVDIDYTPAGGGATANFSGTYEVLSVDLTKKIMTIDATPPTSEVEGANGTYINTTSETIGQWFTLQGSAIEEIWYQVQMPSGIRSSGGSELTVNLTLTVEELDSGGTPTGTTTSQNVSITGNTQDPQFRTFKFTSLTPARYRAKAVRTTNEEIDGIDLVKLEDIQSVTSYSGANFGDVTLLEVDRRGTTFATSQRQSKINALVTRKLELFDPLTGDIDSGVFTETRSFADYVVYILRQQAGIDISDIDTDTLFGIYDSLSDPQLGYFDFTFDDFDIGLRERIQTACNVARVRYYNLPSPSWNFVREEENQVRAAMFNRRNILSGQSSQVYKFQRTADYDSVSVRYVDPVKNTEAIVSRKWNGAAIVSGKGNRTSEIELAGCRNSTQADNRADLEIRKLIYQRRQVQDVLMSDGLFIGLGDRVQWADPNDADIFSGEILGYSGDIYDTSEKFVHDGVSTYYVNITDQDGAVIGNTVTASARSDTEFGFIATGLTGVYLADQNNQLGSRYVIYKQNELTDLTVISIGAPDQQNNVAIEAAEYRSEVFEQD